MLYWDRLLVAERKRRSSTLKKAKHDNRSPFKKDFDTVCNNNTLRRMQDKAQIFPLEQGDYARTRLTHSIEVLATAESLGLVFVNIIRKKKNAKYLFENPEAKPKSSITSQIMDIPVILRTAALLHDMGNPPFGHLCEQVINSWFENEFRHYEYIAKHSAYEYRDKPTNPLFDDFKKVQQEDLLHFDGNAQLFRLVTKLNLVVDENGMNLTYPVMASFIKYPCNSTGIDSRILSRKKAGYFATEESDFNSIVDALGLRNGTTICRHPLAFLTEAADDIAYLTADIEDAHHKGLISVDDILDYVNQYAGSSKHFTEISLQIDAYRKEAETKEYPRHEDYVMHRLRIYLKGIMINAVGEALHTYYDQIMTGTCNEELLMLSNIKDVVNAIKALERDKIYYCREITETKTRASVVIKQLLRTYVLATLNYSDTRDKHKDTDNNLIYQSLSPNYRFICELNNKSYTGKDIEYNKLRLVIDQIAGMTDTRALNVYDTFTAG